MIIFIATLSLRFFQFPSELNLVSSSFYLLKIFLGMTSDLFDCPGLDHFTHFIPVFAVLHQSLFEQLMFGVLPSALILRNNFFLWFSATRFILSFFMTLRFPFILRFTTRSLWFLFWLFFFLIFYPAIVQVIFILALMKLKFLVFHHFFFTVLRKPIFVSF